LSNLPLKVWGVVDMYGRTVKVTIVDRDINEEKNLLTRLSSSLTLSNENQCKYNQIVLLYIFIYIFVINLF